MKRVLLVLAVAACQGEGHSPAVDARPDSVVRPDSPPPRCPDEFLFGKVLDIDSASPPLPLAGVELTAQADTTTTAADGSFELCFDGTTIEVTEPAGYLDTKIVDGAQTVGLYPLQLRMFTSARAQSFYAERGLVFDATRGHVLVFQSGDRWKLGLDRTHGTAQTAEQQYMQGEVPLAWSAGDRGAFVLFPNVDVTAGTARVLTDFGQDVDVPVRANMLTLAITCAVVL